MNESKKDKSNTPRADEKSKQNTDMNAHSSPASRQFHQAAPQGESNVKSAEKPSGNIIPSMEELKGKWQQQVGAAKTMWGKLTEDELLRTEGQQQKLAGLVQERYALSQAEAKKQVNAFFDKQ